MQDLLTGLDPTLVIALLVVGIIIFIGAMILVRRLRKPQTPPEDAASPTLGGPIDYTSLPLDEEPQDWRDRFARLSLPGKILAILVPILALLGVIALVLALQSTPEPQAPLATPIPVTLTVSDAVVIAADPLTIDIRVTTTGLADGTLVRAELREDDQAFAFLDPANAQGEVRRNRAEIEAFPAANAPKPTEGRLYTVVARGPSGEVSAPFELIVPETSGIADAFYQREVVVAVPTATAMPTPILTPMPAPDATSAPTPEPTPEPTPALPTGPDAGVSNGGNVRRLPFTGIDNVIGGVNAGEQVQLLQRTPNGLWFLVRTVRDEVGWVSASLLGSPPTTGVPVAPVVTVFVTGPTHERPDSASSEVDRLNQNEVVELRQRTAAGDWFQVVSVRNLIGWAPANLLGIPPEVAAAVPVVP